MEISCVNGNAGNGVLTNGDHGQEPSLKETSIIGAAHDTLAACLAEGIPKRITIVIDFASEDLQVHRLAPPDPSVSLEDPRRDVRLERIVAKLQALGATNSKKLAAACGCRYNAHWRTLLRQAQDRGLIRRTHGNTYLPIQ
jgi:hypothetical protein